ncbi:hypothetical protein EV284_6419 [Streptomyces sp. BK022]|uniref:hypothetical protein n=1 Tax=Streptomyces sp. BK022 TaxID=2512123 RepID=UPI00102A37DE|nr:hypothetical protein [Streptomyces sp. BK022]RZU28253.1 hypothetical protein EV284_6419 [Streptomyces sp. BK022]
MSQSLSHSPRRGPGPLTVVMLALVVFFAVMVTACTSQAGTDDHDGTPVCRATHTSTGDYVPAGLRPCTLYGSSHYSGDTGHYSGSSSHGSTSRTGSGVKKPARPAAPKPKAPSLVKPPTMPKPAAAPPRVSLSKR